jgi:hypothetical protein
MWLVANCLSHTHARPWWDVTFREVPIVAETYIYILPVGWGFTAKLPRDHPWTCTLRYCPKH